MDRAKAPPVTNPGLDVATAISELIGDTGGVQEVMGGFRIRIYHARAFPWADVLKILVFRDFKVYVRRHKADMFIEAVI